MKVYILVVLVYSLVLSSIIGTGKFKLILELINLQLTGVRDA